MAVTISEVAAEEQDVRWGTFITTLRSTGMPLRDIRRYTELAREGDHTTPERLARLVAQDGAAYERFTTR